MSSQRGQASLEWTGLLLLVSLALGALVALAPRLEGRSLGVLVAHRIVCAARGDCGAAGAERLASPGFDRRVSAETPASAAPGAVGGEARGAPSGARGALLRARRLAGALARRSWIACLGYRRYRFERSHPGRLSPFDAMPVGEGLSIANSCLNPLGFLGDD